MDPPPSLPPHLAGMQTAAVLNYPDSANSSPRSHHTADTWDDPPPQVPGAKLRLMCSYGGHIIPRPHDKSLCYVGGETRIVVAERHSSLSNLHSRLSHSLLNGRQFALKYQLPSEDLDSLVSITTEEDLENMIEEYDRINSASPLKPSRLRLFLFPVKPETAASMGCLLDDAKSESWFVDALNGAGLLPRGLSDSAAMDNLLELEESPLNRDSCGGEMQRQNLSSSSCGGGNNIQAIPNVNQEIHSPLSDSANVETSSSFESTVSSPSMVNLPYIKVRIDDQARLRTTGGLEEQFSQMNVAPIVLQKLDDRSIPSTAATLPLPAVVGGGLGLNSAAAARENFSRAVSDDEKSDHGAPSVTRKPPLPLQPVPRKVGDAYNLPSPESKQAANYNFPSPDSVASDSSIASAASLSRQTYQDTNIPTVNRENRVPAAAVDQHCFIDPSSQNQMLQQQNQPQHLMPPTTSHGHYIQHPATTGQVPISSYYQLYATPQQQLIHQQIDQQYPMYVFPVTQTQPYNLNIVDSTSTSVAATSRPSALANTTTFVPSTAYKEIAPPPIYPVKSTTPQPEMLPNIYRTTGGATPALVQFPTSQFQQQYFGLSQVQTPSQTIPPASASGTNYGYEYAHPTTHDHAYYAQHQAAATLPQYQTMAPASAVMLAQTSNQLTTDNTATEQ